MRGFAGNKGRALLLQFKKYGCGKAGALIEAALSPDSAVHHLHQVLGNGEAKACARNCAYPWILRTFKGDKHFFQKFRSDTDAVVLYG